MADSSKWPSSDVDGEFSKCDGRINVFMTVHLSPQNLACFMVIKCTMNALRQRY